MLFRHWVLTEYYLVFCYTLELVHCQGQLLIGFGKGINIVYHKNTYLEAMFTESHVLINYLHMINRYQCF